MRLWNLGLLLLIAFFRQASVQGCPFAQCDNGQCINAWEVCDGSTDCSDGSDESEDTCLNHNCHSSEFQCDNGQCVYNSDKCDGFTDCSDGSDEDGCPLDGCPFAQCDNGQCINTWDVCDGSTDCSDGSDELEDSCRDHTCTFDDDFQCDYGACIRSWEKCDGSTDCPDGSDEDGFCVSDGVYFGVAWGGFFVLIFVVLLLIVIPVAICYYRRSAVLTYRPVRTCVVTATAHPHQAPGRGLLPFGRLL